ADHPFYLLIPRRMIRCIDVCKTYRQGGSEITALAGVSLDISAGAFAVIMGPSGSGKSTVLHLIGGLDRPSSGDVLVDGKLIGQMPDDQVTLFRRRKIGFVFQFFNLLPTLTALENIALPLVLDGQPRTEAARRAENLLVKVGLENRRGHLPEQLSGGEIQRIAVARAGLRSADRPGRRAHRQSRLQDRRGHSRPAGKNQSRRGLHGGPGDPYRRGGAARHAADISARRKGGIVMLRLLTTISWRHARHHRLRTLLTFFGIALGVAVIVAVGAVNRSLTTSFQSTIDRIAGKAVLQVANGESGIDENLFPAIRDTPGVERAARAALRLRRGFPHRLRDARASLLPGRVYLRSSPRFHRAGRFHRADRIAVPAAGIAEGRETDLAHERGQARIHRARAAQGGGRG